MDKNIHCDQSHRKSLMSDVGSEISQNYFFQKYESNTKRFSVNFDIK